MFLRQRLGGDGTLWFSISGIPNPSASNGIAPATLDRRNRAEAQADAALHGHALIFIDSPVKHAFSFTPAVSLFVDFKTRDELKSAFSTLSSGGRVLMPLDGYGFSTRFGWCA